MPFVVMIPLFSFNKAIVLLCVLSSPKMSMSSSFAIACALFYQWVNMGRRYLGEAFPHDEFMSAPARPILNSLWDDLRRLEEKDIVRLKHKQWGKTEKVKL